MQGRGFAARRSGSAPALAAIAAALFALGCAPKQRVPLDCVPREVEVYVDGRVLEGDRDALELSTREAHKIFVKGPGYEPQLVVLEPRPGAEGRHELQPRDVCVELMPIGLGRELTVEVEEEPGEPTP